MVEPSLPLTPLDGALGTPAVIVERARLAANLARVQAIARERRVRLRPHVKTHKCLEIGRAQLAGGAIGLTCAKVGEATVFLDDGAGSLTIAYPLVDPAKAAAALTRGRERGAEVRLIADSEAGVEALETAARKVGVTAPVAVKIDVGLHRCGLAEDDPRLLPLIARIARAGSLRFLGLIAHAGHAYGAGDAQGVRRVAAEEAATLARVKARIEAAGHTVAEVSVGSTPTVLGSDSYEGITEIRPGNYVFLDLTPVRLGLARLDDVALHILATVVGVNDVHAIVDAGSKVLSSDLGAHGSGAGGFGLAFAEDAPWDAERGMAVTRLSEEHGFVAHGGRAPAIGARLRIVPNPSCPVANLADELIVVGPGDAPEAWRVAARGKVR
jgi:D-serine deaminase-like pyridoxal phosphate-dependent protein